MFGSGDGEDTDFNTVAEVKALMAKVADLEEHKAEMREKIDLFDEIRDRMDLFDGESAEIRLLLEKYQNR